MTIIDRIAGFFGVHRQIDLPPDLKMFFGSNAIAGEIVTKDTALAASAVYACTRILANTFASLPIHTFKRIGDAKERVSDHYLSGLLKYKINPYTTAFMWKQHMMTSLCLSGNAYSQIIFNGRMQVLGLYPLNASRMTVSLSNGVLTYEYRTESGTVTIPADEILHIRSLTVDGFTGLSPLDAARESVGISLSTQRHTANYFKNGATLGTVIKVPLTKPDAAQAKAYQDAFTKAQAGSRNAGEPLFLFGGAELQQPTLNHQQLQFLELRKFTVAEIARIFGVPLHMLNELDRATFSNIEQQSMEFLRDTLRPIVSNVEAELNTTLLSDRERQSVFVEFLLDDFVRADLKSRYDAYGVALGTGIPFLTPNEVRAIENRPPVLDGDRLYIPRQNTPEPTAPNL